MVVSIRPVYLSLAFTTCGIDELCVISVKCGINVVGCRQMSTIQVKSCGLIVGCWLLAQVSLPTQV
jgi:hypothetical protein